MDHLEQLLEEQRILDEKVSSFSVYLLHSYLEELLQLILAGWHGITLEDTSFHFGGY